MGINVGIDLGTTFCAVARINKDNKPEIIPTTDGMKITPSVIQFLPDGSHICGDSAKEASEDGEEGCVSAFKRFMGSNEICCRAYGKEYKAKDLSALLLAHLKSEAEKVTGQRIDGAVITVPAYFANAERLDTLDAASMAGINVLRIINEPTAAALNYSMKHWRENAVIMVYDLGGGTFDVTLVGMGKGHQMTSLATNGNHTLGGKDWDDCIIELIADKVYEETGEYVRDDREVMNDIRNSAERMKKQLSSNSVANCRIYVSGRTVEVSLTRDEFDSATSALLDKTRALCEDLLNGKGLTWKNVTDVLLVGGSTRMPQVADFLKKLIGKDPIRHVNPDEAVALGAAMQTILEQEDYVVYKPKDQSGTSAAKPGLFGRSVQSRNSGDEVLSDYRGPVKESVELDDIMVIGKRDVTSHGLGIISVDTTGTTYINETIIPLNSPIPGKCARALRLPTHKGNDNEWEIFVVNGDGELKDLLNANAVQTKYTVSGIDHVKGGALVRAQYSFDRNGVIHVQARQGTENHDLPIRMEPIDPDELRKFYFPVEKTEEKADLTIVLALDVSGSMSGKPMRDAQDAMIDFVKQYRDTDAEIGVIAVSDSCQWFMYPTSDAEACIRAINSITCTVTGICNSAHPFDEIFDELKNVEGSRYAIILADGMWENQPLAVDKAHKCNRAGIETAAIGFGSADKKFLRDISSQDDLSIFTANSSGLTQSFGKIAQSIGTGGKGGKQEDAGSTTTWETND